MSVTIALIHLEGEHNLQSSLYQIYLDSEICCCCSPNGIAAVYRNDLRQLGVNHRARAVGASDGTAAYYGVPGAGKYVVDNRYGYGYDHGDSYKGGAYSGYAAGPYY